MGTAPPPPDHSGIWYTLWTASKLILVVLVGVAVALLMLTSSEPTTSPAASLTPSPSPVPNSPTPGPTPTGAPTNTPVPQDAFVPGRLVVVQGSTLVMLHGYEPPRQLPIDAGVRQPAFSPDGSQLAYVRWHQNYQDLFVYNQRTGKNTQLTQNAPPDPNDPRYGISLGSPAWSDDGQSIYFSTNYPGYTNLVNDMTVYRCAASGPCSGGAATRVTFDDPTKQSGGNYDASPRLADPTLLVYTKYTYQTVDGNPQSLGALVSRDINSGNEIVLTASDASISQPAWNPSGRYLVFVKNDLDGQHTSIYGTLFHPPGDPQDYTHARLLVKGAPFALRPVFSPDGQYLAYLADNGDGIHVYVAHIRLGQHPRLDQAQLVKRAGIVDGDRLAWTR